MGNICRSPTAEGIMKSLLNAAGFHKQISVDSAGMESYHVGQRADSRAYEMARTRGVTLDSRARQFTIDDFAQFDYVLAMDHVNRDDLLELAPDESAREKIFLLRSFDASAPPEAEVPDPYSGGRTGFIEVFDQCERACAGLLTLLGSEHNLS
jgi:protein-tyrosine phosphatase